MVDCEKCGLSAVVGDNYCRSCGIELPDEDVVTCDCNAIVGPDDNFCHECGQAFGDKNVCGACNTEFEDDAKFCPGCGVELTEADDEDDEGEGDEDEADDGESDEPEEVPSVASQQSTF